MSSPSLPEISVLMPIRLKADAYNQIEWLNSAINSALTAFDGEACELIIIDDGSALPVADLIGDYREDPRIRISTNYTNIGLIRSLNIGLGLARGAYCARIDADDSWEPGRFAIQLEAFKTDPDLALSFGSMNLLDDSGRRTDVHIRSFDWAETIKFCQNVGCAIPHGSILANTRVLRALGGYPYQPQSMHSEDFALWSRLLRFFKVKGEPDIFLNYRVHDASVSAAFRAIQSENTQFIMTQFRAYGPADEFVAAHTHLMAAMAMTSLELGLKLFELWRYGGTILLPQIALPSLRRVLFDRVTVTTSAENDYCLATVAEF